MTPDEVKSCAPDAGFVRAFARVLDSFMCTNCRHYGLTDEGLGQVVLKAGQIFMATRAAFESDLITVYDSTYGLSVRERACPSLLDVHQHGALCLSAALLIWRIEEAFDIFDRQMTSTTDGITDVHTSRPIYRCSLPSTPDYIPPSGHTFCRDMAVDYNDWKTPPPLFSRNGRADLHHSVIPMFQSAAMFAAWDTTWWAPVPVGNKHMPIALALLPRPLLERLALDIVYCTTPPSSHIRAVINLVLTTEICLGGRRSRMHSLLGDISRVLKLPTRPLDREGEIYLQGRTVVDMLSSLNADAPSIVRLRYLERATYLMIIYLGQTLSCHLLRILTNGANNDIYRRDHQNRIRGLSTVLFASRAAQPFCAVPIAAVEDLPAKMLQSKQVKALLTGLSASELGRICAVTPKILVPAVRSPAPECLCAPPLEVPSSNACAAVGANSTDNNGNSADTTMLPDLGAASLSYDSAALHYSLSCHQQPHQQLAGLHNYAPPPVDLSTMAVIVYPVGAARIGGVETKNDDGVVYFDRGGLAHMKSQDGTITVQGTRIIPRPPGQLSALIRATMTVSSGSNGGSWVEAAGANDVSNQPEVLPNDRSNNGTVSRATFPDAKRKRLI